MSRPSAASWEDACGFLEAEGGKQAHLDKRTAESSGIKCRSVKMMMRRAA
jgi:hypothetical protein